MIRRCWCGRTVSWNGVECAEHDDPPPRTEEWRPVVGYAGLYEVSSLGRVRSVDRTITYSQGGTQRQRWFPGQIREQHPNPRSGYLQVGLSRHHRTKTCKVHVLVAEAFLGPRPAGLEVRHLDGRKENCTRENLAYGTPLENAADLRLHGTHRNTRKTHCPKGHPYDEDNTRRNDQGHRWCLTCSRERDRSTPTAVGVR